VAWEKVKVKAAWEKVRESEWEKRQKRAIEYY
jgi:hypothetical protein